MEAERYRQSTAADRARQIGKSYAVREFAKHEYAHYLEINLYENKQAARALASANDVQEFISRLTLFSPSTLIPGDTLIFIDEVQEAPDVMTTSSLMYRRRNSAI